MVDSPTPTPSPNKFDIGLTKCRLVDLFPWVLRILGDQVIEDAEETHANLVSSYNYTLFVSI